MLDFFATDSSALTNKLKLGEDNSDPIKIHLELNCVFSSRPRVRVLAMNAIAIISLLL